jgi:hypothetical protein
VITHQGPITTLGPDLNDEDKKTITISTTSNNPDVRWLTESEKREQQYQQKKKNKAKRIKKYPRRA